MTLRFLAPLVVVAALAGCAQTLPEHDNRIFTAEPVAKLSAIDLAQAFVSDAASATDRFVGKAIEVSGVIRDLAPADAALTRTFLLASGDGPRQVRISLHEDRAAEITKGLANGQRATFRCFCEGVTDHIQLKSCVVP